MVMQMQQTVVAVLMVSLLTLIGCSTSDQTVRVNGSGVKLDAELARVSEVRRLLRSACNKLRAAAKAQDSIALLSEAEIQTEEALTKWRSFHETYSDSAPLTYAAHKDWSSAAHDIETGIHDMLDKIVAKHAAEAFKSCGQACGKFVEMNAVAGLRRTSDVLFRFRKAAKPLAEVLISGNIARLKQASDELRKLRDDAMHEPVGGTGTAEEKRQAMITYSVAVDEFLQAVQKENVNEVAQSYDRMMKAMELTYDIFL